MEAFYTPLSVPPFPFAYTLATSTSSSNSTTSNPWMDSRIWSRLPEMLVDRVIAFLPPPAFFRARSVCKRWYSLLFSHNFLQLYLRVSPRRHWFIFFRQKDPRRNLHNITAATSNPIPQGYLFDPQNQLWYRIPFRLIPSGFAPASSSGGLICWVSDDAGSKTLILGNPVVGSLSPLPPTVMPRLFPSIGLLITDSSIHVAIAGDDLISPFAVKNLTAETFHMDGGGFYSLWETSSSLPRLCSFESGRMVHAKGKFYCMNYSPFSVLAYDIAANHWFKIQAPMRRFIRSPGLVECGGGMLILVAAVEKSKLNVPNSLRLWSLQAETWAEIERMPQQLFVQFAEEEGGRGFDCVGQGEFLVIVIKGSERALMYDFWRKIWVWMPRCPCYDDGGNGDRDEQLIGFGYEPRLAVPAMALVDQLTLPFQSLNG